MILMYIFSIDRGSPITCLIYFQISYLMTQITLGGRGIKDPTKSLGQSCVEAMNYSDNPKWAALLFSTTFRRFHS